jgi:hypothetical protein
MSSTGTNFMNHLGLSSRPSLRELRTTLKDISIDARKKSRTLWERHHRTDSSSAKRMAIFFARVHLAAFSNYKAIDSVRRGSLSFNNVENTCILQVYRALDAKGAVSGPDQPQAAKETLENYTHATDAARVAMFQVLANFHNPDKKSVCAKVGFDYFEIGKESQCQLPSI